ncbi:nucleoside deaminase [Blattabacterium cuenoti]|uniref:nucleoside deaminase n=1 Tax=Blattabacterium cuenoti TaxID=1653831 RepID=UPI00163C60BE|nr:nucleoside deaminase [Blattabacterium cuenoti]
MEIALKEAFKAFNKNEIPIGAIIIYDNIVIAKAHNLTENLKNVTAHAEMQVINIASNYFNKKYIKECTLYVTIEPCVMCAGAIALSKIGKIVCGSYNDSKIGFLNYNIKFHSETIFVTGIMRKKCQSLMKKFFLIKRIEKKIK